MAETKGTREQSIFWEGKSCGPIVTYLGLSSYERYSSSDNRYILVEGHIREGVVARLNPIEIAMFEASNSKPSDPPK
jgi:hypothetical protein